jgi:HK97 family phage prohead protease
MENKLFDLEAELKAEGELGEIVGYGSIFGNIDSYGDIVQQGAFDKSIKKRAPKMLWQHDSSQPIGVWTSIESDGKGLKLKGRLLIDEIEKAREAYALLKAGALSGLSIGFKVKNFSNDAKGVRTLEELELYEVSLVTFPANEKANVTQVRSELPRTVRDFEGFLRDAGYSRNHAKAIASNGFKASENDCRDDGLEDEILNGLKSVLSNLSEIKK